MNLRQLVIAIMAAAALAILATSLPGAGAMKPSSGGTWVEPGARASNPAGSVGSLGGAGLESLSAAVVAGLSTNSIALADSGELPLPGSADSTALVYLVGIPLAFIVARWIGGRAASKAVAALFAVLWPLALLVAVGISVYEALRVVDADEYEP